MNNIEQTPAIDLTEAVSAPQSREALYQTLKVMSPRLARGQSRVRRDELERRIEVAMKGDEEIERYLRASEGSFALVDSNHIVPEPVVGQVEPVVVLNKAPTTLANWDKPTRRRRTRPKTTVGVDRSPSGDQTALSVVSLSEEKQVRMLNAIDLLDGASNVIVSCGLPQPQVAALVALTSGVDAETVQKVLDGLADLKSSIGRR